MGAMVLVCDGCSCRRARPGSCFISGNMSFISRSILLRRHSAGSISLRGPAKEEKYGGERRENLFALIRCVIRFPFSRLLRSAKPDIVRCNVFYLALHASFTAQSMPSPPPPSSDSSQINVNPDWFFPLALEHSRRASRGRNEHTEIALSNL